MIHEVESQKRGHQHARPPTLRLVRLTSSRTHKSIKPSDIVDIELPAFTILTGPNGSGKSNLLEAISQKIVTITELGDVPPDKIRIFRLNELLVTAEGQVNGAQYRESWANAWNHLNNQRINVSQQTNSDDPAIHEQWLIDEMVRSRLISRPALNRMLAAAGKPILDLDADDFRRHAPVVAGVRDAFTTSISEVFLSYAQKRWNNAVAQFRDHKQGTTTALTDEEFAEHYGAPPWSLLNDTLAVVGLPYRFVEPPEDLEQAIYQVELVDGDGHKILTSDLSSGERVLLTIALSLFTTGSRVAEAVELPSILLLDEPDASLHPTMVKSLLTVIEEIFVKQYGVFVMMATHSPTTVALAPEESLYAMSRATPKLQKCTTDAALQMLTVGLSSLSIKVENRRQVFTESEYDQSTYQELFAISKGALAHDRSLEFIAAGRRDKGGGCDTVKRLVTELRATGVDTVYGIVDKDNRGGAPSHVEYVPDRHSIENLVFDPLLLGVFLLREQFLQPPDLGLPGGLRSFELTSSHAPVIAGTLATRLGFDTSKTAAVAYAGGFTVEVAVEFLERRGHDLEALIAETFPQVRRYKEGLKSEVVRKAAGDKPEFVPQVTLDLLNKFL